MSILKAAPEQIQLTDNGEILFQEKVGSPLPGKPVAKIVKGEDALSPRAVMTADQGEDVLAFIQTWLNAHIAKVLEPLVALKSQPDMAEPEKTIAARVYDAMGVLPREELLDLIGELDADKRRVIRSAGIKLGPILVFMPMLNKPAAVRLKALLWSLYNDKVLPALIPADGVVSMPLSSLADGQEIDREMYRQIGYPVYGPRAIRIDMLDRVISSIYEAADKGKFQARHQMAEWLGANIDDLYAVLEAMGHKRIVSEDKPVVAGDAAVSSEEVAPQVESDAAVEVKYVVATEEQVEQPAALESGEKAEAKPANVKPDLDWFFLKRGAAHQKGAAARAEGQPRAKGKQANKDRSIKKKERENRAKKNIGKKKQTMYAGPEKKLEDSPFAILAQLKDK